MPDYLPKTAAQWKTVLLLFVGAFLGSLRRPWTWPAIGPLRAAAMAVAWSAQESLYGQLPSGAAGEVGPLHYSPTSEVLPAPLATFESAF